MVELTKPLISGTEGYAEQADALVDRYESRSFAEIHARVLPLLPKAPGWVLDIGAGTGRDAAGFAALGYDVVAVEPTRAMRAHAERLHPSPRIEWIDGSLPNLACLASRQGSFHGVMMTDVWMHLDPLQRRNAMPNVARLLARGGVCWHCHYAKAPYRRDGGCSTFGQRGYRTCQRRRFIGGVQYGRIN